MPTVDELLDILGHRGGDRYGSERVSQLDHALQCAWLAERQGAGANLITAALLHDVGHLIHKLGENAAARGIDARHEVIGSSYLKACFPDEVVGPIALHVDAKRYLCAAEPGYFDTLSAASIRSLKLQGGPMTDEEAAEFETRPHAEAAIRLRRWDEGAKLPELTTPDLGYFRKYVETCVAAAGG